MTVMIDGQEAGTQKVICTRHPNRNCSVNHHDPQWAGANVTRAKVAGGDKLVADWIRQECHRICKKIGQKRFTERGTFRRNKYIELGGTERMADKIIALATKRYEAQSGAAEEEGPMDITTVNLTKKYPLPGAISAQPLVAGGWTWLGSQELQYDATDNGNAGHKLVDWFELNSDKTKGFRKLRNNIYRDMDDKGLIKVKPFVLTPTKIAEDEQPGFDLYAVFDVVRIKGPVEEDDETEDSGTRIYRGGRTVGPAGEKYKKPTRRFVASFAQKQGCLCAICGREFGIDIVKGNKPPTTLGATFEHWIPDVYLVNTQKSVAERNKNTQDSRNCITCGVCNLAKSDQMGDPDAGIPLTMEQAREISVLAWKPWRVISRDEALTLEGKRLTRKYGIEINVGVVA